MSRYQNSINITSARRLNSQEPSDDRLIFNDEHDILLDIQSGRFTTWFDSMVVYLRNKHEEYVWLPSNAQNQNVDYTKALLNSDFIYPTWYPNPQYANTPFNFYPFLSSAGLSFYTSDEPVSALNLEGFPEGFVPTGPFTLQQMWDKLLYPYQPPLISLSSTPNALPTYYENGFVISAISLSANVIKKKLNIQTVRIFKNNNLFLTSNSPNPNGGVSNFSDSNVSTNTTYYATVFDGQQTVQSNNRVYNFVYPIYIGNLTQTNPSESEIKSLTKRIVPKSNQTFVNNFTQRRYCIAYPKSYGLLKHIYDTNGFETIDDYSIIESTFTMLDNQAVIYYIYVFNYLTDATDFTNTFVF
jgi:hypothetical protein